jgi:hypothetical protein
MLKSKYISFVLSGMLMVSCGSHRSSTSTLPYDEAPAIIISEAKAEVNCPKKVEIPNGLTISATEVTREGDLDLRPTGMTVVKVNLINSGPESVAISPEQFTGTLADVDVSPYSSYEAYRTLYDTFAELRAKRAGVSGALWGALGGTLLGIVVADIFDTDVSPVIQAGALSGGLSGMSASYIKAKEELEKSLEKELGARSLIDKPLLSGARRKGLLFFPSGVDRLRYHLGENCYEITL